MTEVIETIRALRSRLGHRAGHERIVVMTMGALHEGHLELVRAGRSRLADRGLESQAEIVVTDFVNPLQFTDPADLAAYPRTLEEDVRMCASESVDVVFAPTAAEMYPEGQPQITVDPGPLGDELEGAARPGHFRGVLTVVNRLLMLTAPTAAMFGEKDYQQLVLIRRMVSDLLIPVEIVAVPTVREGDGLAMSSRNRRLDGTARRAAVAVPRALARAQDNLDAGLSPAAAASEAAQWLSEQPGVERVDYLSVRGSDLGPAPASGQARALVAASVAGVRLIDNIPVQVAPRNVDR